jgi:hypothetical protein
MSAACAPARTAVYRRRRPERNVLYRTVQTHLATWLELSCDSRQGASGPAHVEREFRRYLECGMLAHGFARTRCGECGHDFLIAYAYIRARAVVSVPPATPGGRSKPLPSWPTTFFRDCRSASGCCRFPSGCVITSNMIRRSKRWRCAFS